MSDKPNRKTQFRAAAAIYEQLTSNHRPVADLQLPTAAFLLCETLIRKRRVANARGWDSASAQCHRALRDTIGQLKQQLSEMEQRLTLSLPIQRPQLTDVYCDLAALHHEFEDVSWQRQVNTLSVTTEPITLEGIDLGRFEIELACDEIVDGPPQCYRVIALDPCPAASSDTVTHPHVQDGVVCEGEGRVAIQEALERGRLLDFFLIVANLLRTYNAGSPYVALADWFGVACDDCGCTVDDDSRWLCEGCETYVCGDCYYLCVDCDSVCCSQCVRACDGCTEYHCGSCLRRCGKCCRHMCDDCLNPEERCEDCHEKESEKEQEATDGTSAALQPHGVGEASVPAGHW